MAGLNFSLSFTLPNVPNLGAVMNKGNLPLLHKAVAATANATAVLWKERVATARLWNGEKQAYIASIKVRWLNDLHAEVYSDYPNAQPIEAGRPPVDLKRMLATSSKVRVSQKGNRFLVIPMLKSTPDMVAHGPAMPPSVYELAKDMEMSSVASNSGARQTGELTFLSPGSGMTPMANQPHSAGVVPRMQYKWGGKVTNAAMKAAGVSAKERKLYAGMVKMDASTPGAKSSVYLTFRTMSDKSAGWQIPARPGMNIAAKVASDMQPLAQAALSEAVKREAQNS
ncbi:hypothetical protein [Paraburkholderia sp. BCC1876]|uniref:hypothetical protein n=1 Tax=Paraburkholderia sp. BCC1876 TaxID=2676303 RepID=UPI001590E90A|nr:hypothetical protein [Paraburkholderia sp. BCC1876]